MLDPKLQSLINTVNSRSFDYLERAKDGKTFVCPICGSGSGQNGTGIAGKDLDTQHPRFTCFAGGCFSNADLLEIITKERGLDGNIVQRVQQAADAVGVSYNREDLSSLTGMDSMKSENRANSDRSEPFRKEKFSVRESEEKMGAAPCKKKEVNYSDYINACADRLNETEYMMMRGISKNVCEDFQIGFDPECRNPASPNGYPSPRVIIPTSKFSYVARATDSNGRKVWKAGNVRIFNADALSNEERREEPLYVVEGEIDALSVITAGGDAVALGGAGNRSLFVETVQDSLLKKGFIRPLLICMDNDKPGKDASPKLIAALAKIGIKAHEFNLMDGINRKDGTPCKDANDALLADHNAFSDLVWRGKDFYTGLEEREAEEALEELESESARAELENFLKVCTSPKVSYPTGFKELDKQLNGGLHAGLYGVGAIPSLGKTTFCLQIADNLAASGRDVLIFSLEMSRHELIAKSISRMSYAVHHRDCAEKAADASKLEEEAVLEALTTFEVMNAHDVGDTKLKTLAESVQQYHQQCANHVYIVEGMGNVRTGHIIDKLKKFKAQGKKPVVFVDYLQLIAADPEMDRASDKQVIDKNVMELKRISRDYDLPVVVVSSFNRDAYRKEADMTSFKESGAIEYSADVLLGLQYKETGGVIGLTDAEKERIKEGLPIEIEVKMLKNRNGYRQNLRLKYVPKFNTYMDGGEIAENTSDGWEEVK